jgi:hypothetical protein
LDIQPSWKELGSTILFEIMALAPTLYFSLVAWFFYSLSTQALFIVNIYINNNEQGFYSKAIENPSDKSKTNSWG